MSAVPLATIFKALDIINAYDFCRILLDTNNGDVFFGSYLTAPTKNVFLIIFCKPDGSYPRITLTAGNRANGETLAIQRLKNDFGREVILERHAISPDTVYYFEIGVWQRGVKEARTRYAQILAAEVLNNPPKPINDNGEPYADILADEEEISDYVATLSDHDVDEEFMQEHFRGCSAVLKLISVKDLKEGHPDSNLPSLRKNERYAKKNIATMPPLLVENGEIRDGNHRFRGRRDIGQTRFWCYDIEADTED
jgi:hypothetical protein